jgi:hypothetical protein
MRHRVALPVQRAATTNRIPIAARPGGRRRGYRAEERKTRVPGEDIEARVAAPGQARDDCIAMWRKRLMM